MRIDSHVHLADARMWLQAGNGKRHGAVNWRLSRMTRAVLCGESLSGAVENANDEWADILARWVETSSLDRVVLLALDGVYDRDGREVPESTMLRVDNDFVHRFVARHPQFLFGASVHPYRKDAVEELARVVAQGARLIKWIPSVQHLEPDDERCYPFYEALVHYGIPLLTHTGIEHALGSRRANRNHPAKLIPALQAGVKVIAAHCGAHLFLHEPSYFRAWAALAREHENLFGDLGAFAIVTRARFVRKIFRDDILSRKVLYGSDFPTIPATCWCWQLGVSRMRKLSAISNPLERNLRTMMALGMPEHAFENTGRALSAPGELPLNVH